MSETSATFTGILLLILVLILLLLFLYHYVYGNRERFWSNTCKEEKVGFSHKLFKPNGYMIHSGSELLFSSTGSFKRFDTIDKENHHFPVQQQQSQQQPQRLQRQQHPLQQQQQQQQLNLEESTKLAISPCKQSTSGLWNLPQVDTQIPPQPLRPAPAPNPITQGSYFNNCQATKTISFSPLPQDTEIGGNFARQSTQSLNYQQDHSEMFSLSQLKLSNVLQWSALRPQAIDVPAIEAPPKTHSSNLQSLQTTAIPRPVVKVTAASSISLEGQENGSQNDDGIYRNHVRTNDTKRSPLSSNNDSKSKTELKQSNTNPFLESVSNSNIALNHTQTVTNNNYCNGKATSGNPFTSNYHSDDGCGVNSYFRNRSNSENERKSSVLRPLQKDSSPSIIKCNENGAKGLHVNRNNLSANLKSQSNMNLHPNSNLNKNYATNITNSSLRNISATLHSLNLGKCDALSQIGSNNPFNKVAQKVKRPQLLQKTISEDFLFRKLSMANGGERSVHRPAMNGGGSPNGGSWNLSRLMLPESGSPFNNWRRNNSQTSLDSIESTGSSESLAGGDRAMSCDSVNGTTDTTTDSVDSTGLRYQSITNYTQITGYLCVRLDYNNKDAINDSNLNLLVTVLEAKGLIVPFKFDSLDTFVRIYLVPDQAGALQTKVIKNCNQPSYQESFEFCLKKQMGRHSLWFHLYHNGTAHTLIGEAEMEIGETARSITTWIPLTDSRKCNARWGEIMFSLSYLPTAERLTVVVVKGRNLQVTVPSAENPDILHDVQSVFVKVYLMNNEKKIMKKRTSVKRKDRCPVFNESLIFSLPPQNLTTAQLRLTVYAVLEESTVLPIGHVVTGSCATGKGLRHWHQMLSSLRKPVAMWHVLRRGTNQPIFTGGADAVVAAMQTTAQRAKRNSIF